MASERVTRDKMPTIRRLNDATTFVLNATQVITSPQSVVKELLENALDARATVISIEIAANTVDVVQVRDNGHGIAPDDRGICCAQNTTSKVNSITDVSNVGGTSLGFRGQALFALAQVAGQMEIVTRVEGETAAIKLDIGLQGVVAGSITSQPIGTTVRVANVFDRIPVRKQKAEKDASKCLVSIRKMLQAYTLARPRTRLAMRVLKAKNAKLNFAYGPNTSHATVQDAAFKVVGTEPASQCFWSTSEVDSIEVQGLLPRPDAIVCKISNIGHFVSVDQRPVVAVRGSIKQVCKRITEKMKASNASLFTAKDLFFVINITCPRGSYDPNVEPAKDDVVFSDESKIFAAVDKLLQSAYPIPDQQYDSDLQITSSYRNEEVDLVGCKSQRSEQDHGLAEALAEIQHKTTVLDNVNRGTLIDAPILSTSTTNSSESVNIEAGKQTSSGSESSDHNILCSNTEDIWQKSMYGCDEDDLEMFSMEQIRCPETYVAELQEDDWESHNPWTIAKMNTQLKPRLGSVAGEHTEHRKAPSSSIRHRFAGQASLPVLTPILESSNNTQQTPGSQQNHLQRFLPCSTGQRSAMLAHEDARTQTGLPTPLPSSSPDRQLLTKARRTDTRERRQGLYDSEPNKRNANPLCGVSAASNGSRLCPPRTTQLRPVRDGIIIRKPWQRTKQRSQAGASMKQANLVSNLIGDKRIEHDFRAGLRRAGDQLALKYAQKASDELGPRELSSPMIDTSLSFGARACSDRDQYPPQSASSALGQATISWQDAEKMSRSKSSRLPLEHIPDTDRTHNVTYKVTLSPLNLERLMNAHFDDLSFHDATPNCSGGKPSGFSNKMLREMSTKAVELLQKRLENAKGLHDVETTHSCISVLNKLERHNENTSL